MVSKWKGEERVWNEDPGSRADSVARSGVQFGGWRILKVSVKYSGMSLKLSPYCH